jgi:transmembrane sensor
MAQAAREWIIRLSCGDISDAELAELALWRDAPPHETVFQHELALWRSLDAARDHLAPRPDVTSLPSHRRFRRTYAITGLAACLALFAAAPEALLRFQSDYRTSASVTAFALPDGSQATLDAGSAIAVHFGNGERRIDLLRGRAWFNVVHDNSKPFRVAANGAVVEDVGTAFVVSAEGDGSEAAVTSGIVQVKYETARDGWMRLTAGQRVSWTSGNGPMRQSDVPVSRLAAWREGDVLLNEAPVRTAIHEIARYRSGPTFILGEMDSLAPVTAIIRADRPDEGLDALASSASLTITRLPGGFAIVRPIR